MGGALFAVATAAAPCAMADKSAPRAARNDKHDNGLSTAQELSTRKRNGKRKVPPHPPKGVRVRERSIKKHPHRACARGPSGRSCRRSSPTRWRRLTGMFSRRDAEGMANEAGECRAADPAHCRVHGERNAMEMVSCKRDGKHDEK